MKSKENKMKRNALVVLLLVFTLSMLLVSCGDGSKSAKDGNVLDLTWWISRGEDSTYYMSYNDNPAIKYIETLEFNGKKHIDFKLS